MKIPAKIQMIQMGTTTVKTRKKGRKLLANGLGFPMMPRRRPAVSFRPLELALVAASLALTVAIAKDSWAAAPAVWSRAEETPSQSEDRGDRQQDPRRSASATAGAPPTSAPDGAMSTRAVAVEVHTEDPPEFIRLEVETSVPNARAVVETVDVPLVGGRGRLAVPAAPNSQIRIGSPDRRFWVDRPEVDQETGAARVLVLPASAVDASIEVSGKRELPSELNLFLHPPDSAAPKRGEQPRPFEVTCKLAERLVPPCKIPAGRWHVRLKAPGFVPVYRWSFLATAAKTASLGDVVLVPGASVFGRVVTEGGPADPKTATVELRPSLDVRETTDAQRSRIENLTLTTSVNDWGYFQFDAVPPGPFELEARQPGYQPAAGGRVVVHRDADLELKDAVVLERALHVRVIVAPETDTDGEPWRIEAMRSENLAPEAVVAEGRTHNGEWVSPPLSRASFRIRVFDSQDHRMAAERFALAEDGQQLRIVLPIVAIEGRVSLGDDPLAAELSFYSKSSGSLIETEAGDDGRFTVVLPRPGKWRVNVEAYDPPVAVAALQVAVVEEEELLIELPDTLVVGDVVDALGKPVPGANVIIVHPASATRAQIVTDQQGGFEFRGLPEASYSVEASDRGRTSEQFQLAVSESGNSPFVRLVLGKAWRLRGQVLSRGRPVGHAQLLGYPFTEQGLLVSVMVPEARSKLDGSFVLELHEAATRVRLVILAPGSLLTVLSVDRPSSPRGEPVRVELPGTEGGGTLELGSTEQLQGSLPVIIVNGEPLERPLLELWSGLNGAVHRQEGGLTVPAMPAGSYAYCTLAESDAMLVFSRAAFPAPGACSEGFLSPRGTLSLTLATP